MSKIRKWLVLGRISNLTTVWANALCAWILGGAGATNDLITIIVGLSLLYIGGMYLNDYCDAGFDHKHRPERPIPSGKVKRNTVLAATILMFVSGIGLISWTNKGSFGYALVLLALILSYNLIHKHNAMIGVPLMASCRSAVYLVVGSASLEGINPFIRIAAFLMFFYVLGITLLARNESTSLRVPSISYVFLIIPMAGAFYIAGPHYDTPFLIAFCLAALWIAATFYRARETGTFVTGKVVGPLLAGICLIDLAILNSMYLMNISILGLFVGFFVFALMAQRVIPAT